MDPVARWLVECDEPWTRYRATMDLLGCSAEDPGPRQALAALLADLRVQALLADAGGWETTPIRRHNDSAHPLYKLGVLAEFGLRAGDPGVAPILAAVLARQSPEGAFQSMVNVPAAFGGSGQDEYAWLACDAPTLLYVLLAFGLPPDDPRIRRAVAHLEGLGGANGWGCAAAGLGRFRGPGRKGDPCPIANVLALKALGLVPGSQDSQAVRGGIEMLLRHWQAPRGEKYYLFGVGSGFRKLKYPWVWYDILHVAEALSRFPLVYDDPRFRDLLAALGGQADETGRFRAGSMYLPWKSWSFADKKAPSPWLTLLVKRIFRRVGDAKG